MPNEMTWKNAIDKVLKQHGKPMHYSDITEEIVTKGLRKSLGATPSATVSANITSDIKLRGDASRYIRVDKGVFALRGVTPNAVPMKKKLTPEVEESEEGEEQYDIVSSFGMFWRREAIDWAATPKILGAQRIGADPVDFNKQLGIYLLYDGREVIYVGRTTDRPLGRRLYEHTFDRLSARWDRFSWFGLLPVTEKGELEVLPDSYLAAKLIPALEAILIEALEPRQNRKRGDDLASVEYLQVVDPAIEKKKMKATFDAALNKL
jgi:hypothetical protein